MPRSKPDKLVPFPEPTFDTVPVRNLIDQLSFRAARAKDRFGRPQVPHEYTVLKEDNHDPYVALFQFVQVHGRDERFGRQTKKYLYPGDGWKYWAMTTDVYQSIVINRMKIEDDLERLRREGQAT